jgi:hypothetical protein
MPCVYLLYCNSYFLTAGADGLCRYWSRQRGRNQNSNGNLGVRASSVDAGRQGGRSREICRQAGRQAGSSVDE